MHGWNLSTKITYQSKCQMEGFETRKEEAV